MDGMIPRTAQALVDRAEGNGWHVTVHQGRGRLLDSNGDPVMEHGWEPVVGEDGKPVMTKPKKPTTKPKQAKRKTTSMVPRMTDCVALDMRRGQRRIVAFWIDGGYVKAYSDPPWIAYGSEAVKAAVDEPEDAWVSLRVEYVLLAKVE